jgi:hypothetical protein
MRKALLVMAATAALSMLAACNSNNSSSSSAPQAAAPPPPPQTKMPEPKPATESSAVGEGAYGMPHAPVPYDQLTAYEAEQGHLQSGRAAPGPYEEQQPAKNRRQADSVFY